VPRLESTLGYQGFLFIFIGFNLVAMLFVGITCIETKGLTENEISSKYAKKIGAHD
jgi:hypothetical protein